MALAPRQQIITVLLITILSGFSLVSIVNFTNPFEASWGTFLTFYLSLFLFCLGIFSLIGLGLRKWSKQGIYITNLSGSLRQAFLLSVLVVASFWLMGNGLFYWWVEASLILFLVFVEIFLNLKT
ncbi:MAG: hypothetical protein COT92_01470 [Candidatus Doudnabacteria bacterium CG10_big_fil_rev_8_21_14_0_10_42_18]|uniref:Uncharacterized protein n=1 Tax=Candidatus Doudnabacteria bacterium CG10_big_fil_rev_8_21_14_0_10_42_18 TaxID=1974552 RepID=A0A2H0VB98_9BACT|nr:MAG: hypothetical protein COT92_01470 [Candidatus Doudnabacteria bacterium CG10_big_fil_rev_8_21_14_0_10_42_18]